MDVSNRQPLGPSPSNNPRRGYRTWEVANSLGIGRSAVYGLIRDGKLKATKIGGLTLILASELEAFLLRCQEEGEIASMPSK
jgi:excisionase family DNA binding protein